MVDVRCFYHLSSNVYHLLMLTPKSYKLSSTIYLLSSIIKFSHFVSFLVNYTLFYEKSQFFQIKPIFPNKNQFFQIKRPNYRSTLLTPSFARWVVASILLKSCESPMDPGPLAILKG